MGRPLWLVSWTFCLLCLIPYWFWLTKRDHRNLKKARIDFRWFVGIAYAALVSVFWSYGSWYGQYFAFSAVISPIIEELLTRFLLSDWLHGPRKTYFGMAIASSAGFAVMHWGYQPSTIDLSFFDQIVKFFSHFFFGLMMGLLFRWVKTIGPVILVHSLMNIRAIL